MNKAPYMLPYTIIIIIIIIAFTKCSRMLQYKQGNCFTSFLKIRETNHAHQILIYSPGTWL